MKHLCGLTTLILSMVFFCFLAEAQEIWEVHKTYQKDTLKKTRYQIRPSEDLCCAVIIIEGKALQVLAEEKKTNRFINQQVFIRPQGVSTEITHTEKDAHGNISFVGGKSKDIFGKNCRSYTQALPLEVRKMFLGQWNIQ